MSNQITALNAQVQALQQSLPFRKDDESIIEAQRQLIEFSANAANLSNESSQDSLKDTWRVVRVIQNDLISHLQHMSHDSQRQAKSKFGSWLFSGCKTAAIIGGAAIGAFGIKSALSYIPWGLSIYNSYLPYIYSFLAGMATDRFAVSINKIALVGGTILAINYLGKLLPIG